MRRFALFLLFAVIALPFVAFAQAAPVAPAPSPILTLLQGFLTPEGIASIVGTLAAIIFGFFKLDDLRKKQVAQGTYHAFHFVEDLAATTDNTIDDKVAAGLKALDAFMLANGWRPLKPGETEVAKLQFAAMNGQTKVAEKIATAAAAASSPTPAAAPSPT